MAAWQRWAYEWVSAPALLVAEGSSSTDAQTSYVTASIDPIGTGSGLFVLVVGSGQSLGVTAVPSVSGMGLTWTQRADQVSSNANQRLTVFTGDGTPSAGALTISYTGAMDACTWQLVRVQGMTAFVEAVSGNGSSSPATATLTGVTSGNVVIGAMVQNSTSAAIAGDTGWTLMGASPTATTPSVKTGTVYGTGVTPSFTTGSVAWAAAALELSGAGGPAVHTKTGGATAGLTGSGADVVQTTETGAGATGTVGTGADVVTRIETGAGVVGTVGSAADAVTTTETGAGVITGVGSGTKSRLYTKIGSGASGQVASGVKVVQRTETGTGVISGIGSGPKTTVYTKTGAAATGLTGSGPKALLFTKTGASASTLAATGTDVAWHTETGSGVYELTSSGVRQLQYTETGAGVLEGVGSGFTGTEPPPEEPAGRVIVRMQRADSLIRMRR